MLGSLYFRKLPYGDGWDGGREFTCTFTKSLWHGSLIIGNIANIYVHRLHVLEAIKAVFRLFVT